MGVKIYRLDKMPVNNEYESISELDEFDLEDVYKLNADAIFYWYAQGCYEGSGQMIIMKDGKFYIHNMSHCSCYGPTEKISLSKPFDKLDDIESWCSDMFYKDEVKAVVDFAKEKIKEVV